MQKKQGQNLSSSTFPVVVMQSSIPTADMVAILETKIPQNKIYKVKVADALMYKHKMIANLFV